MQDSDEDEGASSRTLSFSPCFLNNAGQESRTDRLRDSLCWKEAMGELRNPSLIFLYSQVAKIANKQEMDRTVWVQTRAQHGEPANKTKLPVQKRKRKSMGQKEMKAVVRKQRQSPLSSWIGKEAPRQGRQANDDGRIPAWFARYPVGRLRGAEDSGPADWTSRRSSSRARMRRFIIRGTPKCTTFSILCIIGQAWMQR